MLTVHSGKVQIVTRGHIYCYAWTHLLLRLDTSIVTRGHIYCYAWAHLLLRVGTSIVTRGHIFIESGA